MIAPGVHIDAFFKIPECKVQHHLKEYAEQFTIEVDSAFMSLWKETVTINNCFGQLIFSSWIRPLQLIRSNALAVSLKAV